MAMNQGSEDKGMANRPKWQHVPRPSPTPDDIALAKAIWRWWTDHIKANESEINVGLERSPAALSIADIYASPPAMPHGQRATLRALALLLRTGRIIQAPSHVTARSINSGQDVAVFFHAAYADACFRQCPMPPRQETKDENAGKDDVKDAKGSRPGRRPKGNKGMTEDERADRMPEHAPDDDSDDGQATLRQDDPAPSPAGKATTSASRTTAVPGDGIGRIRKRRPAATDDTPDLFRSMFKP